MKYIISILALLLISVALAYAQLCAPSPVDYERVYRPIGEPANYPIPSEPACLYYTTSGE